MMKNKAYLNVAIVYLLCLIGVGSARAALLSEWSMTTAIGNNWAYPEYSELKYVVYRGESPSDAEDWSFHPAYLPPTLEVTLPWSDSGTNISITTEDAGFDQLATYFSNGTKDYYKHSVYHYGSDTGGFGTIFSDCILWGPSNAGDFNRCNGVPDDTIDYAGIFTIERMDITLTDVSYYTQDDYSCYDSGNGWDYVCENETIYYSRFTMNMALYGSPVPEPRTAVLMAIGCLFLWVRVRSKNALRLGFQ
jgi:hypothetical protein